MIRKLKVLSTVVLFFFTAIVINSCSRNPSDKTFNIFSVDDDINLGKKVKAEIEANPTEYPILPEATNQQAYTYLRNIVTKILNSGKVFYKDKFEWQVYIVDNDSVINAFCVPGGYMYVYTGLIKYLESEDQLAGVMGHEMAHADRRHSTDQLTRQYSIQVLLQVAFGNNSNVLSEIASNMVLLKYSRDAESEADEYAVTYLCPTDYKADGFKRFFEKLDSAGGGNVTDFFSTHPSPDKRVANITETKAEQNCTGGSTYDANYAAFRSLF